MPMEVARVHDFLLMRHPVTCRYLEFLNDLYARIRRRHPAGAAGGEASDPFWP